MHDCCIICLDSEALENPFLPSCSRNSRVAHHLCIACSKQYAEHSIRESKHAIRCPAAGCDKEWRVQDCTDLDISLATFEKHQQQRSELVTMDEQNDEAFVELLCRGVVQCCTTCGVPTIRNGGCPNMTCSRCGSRWRWGNGLNLQAHSWLVLCLLIAAALVLLVLLPPWALSLLVMITTVRSVRSYRAAHLRAYSCVFGLTRLRLNLVIRVFWETALYVIGGLGARMVLTFLWSLSLPTFGSFFVFSGAAAVVAVTFIQMALQTGPMRFMLYFVGLCSAVYLVVSWVLIPALVLVSFAHECFIFPLEYALDAVGRIPHTLGVSIISHCGAIFAGYPAATLSKLLLWPLPTASIRAVTPPLAPSAPGFFTGIFAALISAIVNWIFSCVVSIFWMFVSFAPFFAVIAFTAFILGKIVTWETQHLTKHAPRHQACRQAPRHQACRQAPSRQPQSNANQNNHQNGRRNVTGSVRWPKVANNKAANNKKPKNRQNKRC